MEDFFFNVYKETSETQILFELIAFVFGITSVIMAKKENILVFPTGIVSTVITIYLLFKAQYFGDMTVNIYYSVMSIYGWVVWTKNKNQPTLPISKTTTKEKYIGFILFIFTMTITYYVYQFFDYDMKIPNYIDIFTSGIFFTAMWLMAIKKIENWILWIIGDIIAIPLFAYRGLGMLALQYLIFTILAVSAFYQWKKILNKNVHR